MWINFFFKILLFNICFFIFLLNLTFYFQFCLSVLVNKFWKFLFFLFYGLDILSKKFGKSWDNFLKTIDIWNPKFLINSIVYCLFFIFLFFSAFWYSVFPISPIQTCQKILNIFVVLYCTDYRIYQTIFIKKIRDTLNTNIFRIPSFTICFFNFLVFLTSFFSILHVYGFQKNCKIFVLFYCMDLRFYQKIEIFEI